jgi:hypothetical protein
MNATHTQRGWLDAMPLGELDYMVDRLTELLADTEMSVVDRANVTQLLEMVLDERAKRGDHV